MNDQQLLKCDRCRVQKKIEWFPENTIVWKNCYCNACKRSPSGGPPLKQEERDRRKNV